MKTDQERKDLIEAINVLLNQAYDSTIDEIHALLLKIEAEEDENDLRAYHAAKSDADNNSLIAWEDIKKETVNLVNMIEKRFARFGDFELREVVREPMRPAPTFE